MGWGKFIFWGFLFGACADSAPFGLTERIPLDPLAFPDRPPFNTEYEFQNAFPEHSFSKPIFITNASDGSNRLFVVEQTGKIRSFRKNQPSEIHTFLDLSHQVSSGSEQGLLGLAFAPDYKESGLFYVNYTARQPLRTVVSQFRVSSTNPNQAELGSEKIILTVGQPYGNHNGGMISFGPDGYLYIGLGDGGAGGDPQGHGQNLSTLLGSIVRIAPRAEGGYDIPANNPNWQTPGAKKEIWAYGLRNPWRFSFDRKNGKLWLADVGQSSFEEIDIIKRGKNYGWVTCEGNHRYPQSQMPCPTGFEAPIFEYGRSEGFSITGGYVYRGVDLPELQGGYLYGDFGGSIWVLFQDEQSGEVKNHKIGTLPQMVSAFGEDESGEVYIVGYERNAPGKIFKLKKRGNQPPSNFPLRLSETGLFKNTATLSPNPGMIPYGVQVPLWSDGANKTRWMALPNDEKVNFSATGHWKFPVGTVLVKHFELKTVSNPNHRLETRALVHFPDGWQGFTYKWNEAQTDADLIQDRVDEVHWVPDAATGGQRQQKWTYPSRSDCLRCHTTASGQVLGLNTRQLNSAHQYAEVSDNQLRAWNHVELFHESLQVPSEYSTYPKLQNSEAPVANRARAYLAVNCAQCHQPGGPTNNDMDFRYTTALNDAKLLGIFPTSGSLGLVNAARIRAGKKESSVVWERMRRLDHFRMPAIGSNELDPEGIELIGKWIDSLQ